MNQRKSFLRKLVYLAIIVGLLLPNAMLSMPADQVVDNPDIPGSLRQEGGGYLAQIRQENRLSNDQLGNLDPTSETLKLASLGLRVVAVAMLWTKANEYKKKEDWSNMIAAVDTIFRLQPHFISVWKFQAWNVSYNVSVEWDDYRDRYYWVMRGIETLQRGTKINNDDPILLWDTGWFVSHKIGKSDEKRQFRRLFKTDDDFHGARPLSQRDNWYVGKIYYRQAEQVIDNFPNRVFKGTARVIFHATPGLNNFYQAMGMAGDNLLGEVTQRVWQVGEQEWSGTEKLPNGVLPLGYREIKLALEDTLIQLNKREEWLQIAFDAKRTMADHQELLAEVLSEAQYQAVQMHDRHRDFEHRDAADAAEKLLLELSNEAPSGSSRQRDLQAAYQAVVDFGEATHMEYWIDRYRDIVNFDYWNTRCQAEQSEAALRAHQYETSAREAFEVDAALAKAQEDYARCLENWRLVLEAYPLLASDDLTAEDLIAIIQKYRDVQLVLSEEFPIRGYGLISVADVPSWPELLKLLVSGKQSETDSLEHYLWSLLSEPTQQLLSNLDFNQLSLKEKLKVLAELNVMMENRDLVEHPAFAAIWDQADWKDRYASEDGLKLPFYEIRVRNRRLLDEALGGLIQPTNPNEFVLADIIRTHAELVQGKGLNPASLLQPPSKPEPVRPATTDSDPMAPKPLER